MFKVRGKLSEQKQLHESVRTDKNLYSKALIESQDEIAEMKRKFTIMYHQIEQLKEEIKEKNMALVKQGSAHHRQGKDSDRIKDMLSKQNKKFQGLQGTASAQQAEIQRLNAVIQNSESERLTRRQEHESLTAQRDLLGTQLIRRNDELALLYEKIKVQMRTLCSGEISFQEKKEEIRLMKLRIDSLRRQLRLEQTRANTSDDSKRKFYMLQRALLQERTKVRALSEELENPQNVHRWRKLEGMDPSHSEMIAKVIIFCFRI